MTGSCLIDELISHKLKKMKRKLMEHTTIGLALTAVNRALCFAAVAAAISACSVPAGTSLPQEPSAGASVANENGSDGVHALDAIYRSPLLGMWKLHKEVFHDGGQRTGEGAYLALRENGTYEWSGYVDRRVDNGFWHLMYTSEPDGSTTVFLFLDDEHNTPERVKDWEQYLYTVSQESEDGVNYMVLHEVGKHQAVLYSMRAQ
jgi:hypothetical protein